MSMGKRLALLLIFWTLWARAEVGMVPVTGEGAKYWPRWRGPSGQGLAEGSGYPDKWSDRENVLWKAALPGSGNSSPIIWGDRIFLTTAYDSGVWPLNKQRRSILCLRRQDGKIGRAHV